MRKPILFGAVALVLVGGTVYAIQNHDVRETLAHVVDAMAGSNTETIPAGTTITIQLEDGLSTRDSRVGDTFSATVVTPVEIQGRVLIPEEATIHGQVALVEQPGKVKGRGHLRLRYEALAFGGRRYDLDTRGVTYESESGAGRDAAMIGGGAVVGGIIGGVTGRSGGDVARGALAGGAVGTAASLATRGPQLAFEPGTVLSFRLDHDLEVVRPRVRARSEV